MRRMRTPWSAVSVFSLATALAVAGCHVTPVDTSDYDRGPAPKRMPSPARESGPCACYEDSLTGAQVFSMYCSYCHNPPALGERSYAQFRNIAAHMRVRANLTGKEYAKLMEFLRQWHDVPPPNPPVPPSPKRFTFSQPIAELRKQTDPPTSLGNPGLAPREAHNTPAAPADPEKPLILPAVAPAADPAKP